MSVASRTAAGWISRAAWYYEHGMGIQALYDAWGGYDAGENANTLNNIWNKGVQSANVGAFAGSDDNMGNIPLGQIPGTTGAQAQFRYGVLAQFHPSNGLADQPIYFMLVSPFQLSRAQLDDEARNHDPAATTAARGGRSYGPADVTWTLAGLQVLSLERR